MNSIKKNTKRDSNETKSLAPMHQTHEEYTHIY